MERLKRIVKLPHRLRPVQSSKVSHLLCRAPGTCFTSSQRRHTTQNCLIKVSFRVCTFSYDMMQHPCTALSLSRSAFYLESKSCIGSEADGSKQDNAALEQMWPWQPERGTHNTSFMLVLKKKKNLQPLWKNIQYMKVMMLIYQWIQAYSSYHKITN